MERRLLMPIAKYQPQTRASRIPSEKERDPFLLRIERISQGNFRFCPKRTVLPEREQNERPENRNRTDRIGSKWKPHKGQRYHKSILS